MTFFARLSGAVTLAALATGPALAQQVTLTLAHVAPPQTTFQDAAVRFQERLAELSGGTIGVDIVPGAA
ncbi:MAG: C4-dicarboxylate ABC transporter, partial [Pararhodobacter sp.]